uniref:EOG090X05NZ n=1 Tax=Scapholeberis mucronata TaxID=202097 RepID=A0A4Y7NK25_9CRUS|nr:EOG090X05NZ [Scapholeberis mucronata]SVE93598.1 EOG090X05NZ [Scapholeberis mucronata]
MVFLFTCRLSVKLHANTPAIANKQQLCILPQMLITRDISGKAKREGMDIAPKPPPFPYKEKYYGFFQAFLDSTTSRFDENTKLIVVDGPPASGKGALAQELAEEFGMAYFRRLKRTDRLIKPSGFNVRDLDPLLPPSCQSYDETDFLKDPCRENGGKAARLQLSRLRFNTYYYLEALAHIANTGQGQKLYVSFHFNPLLAYALGNCHVFLIGYNLYCAKRKSGIQRMLWRPHLVIYLDVPVDETRRRIEARNLPYEKDSKATSPEYLKAMEDCYKNEILKEASVFSEVLIYDWAKGGSSDVVVEDIERIDFDKYGIYDTKMQHWRLPNEWAWNFYRYKFTNRKRWFRAVLSIVPPLSTPSSYYQPNYHLGIGLEELGVEEFVEKKFWVGENPADHAANSDILKVNPNSAYFTSSSTSQVICDALDLN